MDANESQNRLLLVSGCPRSGTTLINFILNSHPNVAMTNEIDLVALASQISECLFKKDRKFKQNKITRSWSNVESWTLNDFGEHIPNDSNLIPEVLRLFCNSVKSTKSSSVYGDKTPTYYLYDIEQLVQLSSTKEIYLIRVTRSPMEVVDSIMRRTNNSLRGKDYWKSIVTKADALSHWIKAWNARAQFRQHRGVRFLDLNYNGIAQDPETALQLIANFLQISNDFDSGILNTKRLLDKRSADNNGIAQSSGIKYYCSNWDKMPLNLSDQLEILPVVKSSLWNRVQRKFLVSLIRARRNI